MLKPYPKYKDSGVSWIGMVPVGWEVVRFKYIFKERIDKGHPDETMLTATQNHGVISKEQYENRTVVAQKDLHLLKLVRIGDFVISLRSFQGGIEYAYTQGIISPAYTIIYTKCISNKYFRILGKSKPFIQLLQSCVTGIREGQNIDYQKLKNEFIPHPPRSEQDAIVAYLDDKIAKIDRLIGLYKREIELLKERRQAVIHKAVTRGLDDKVKLKDSGVSWIGMVPQGWEVKRLKRLFSFGKGLPITKADLISSGLAVISYGQIHSKKNSGVCLSDELIRYVDDSFMKTNLKSQVFTGDFIFADTSEDIEGCGNCVYIDHVENPIFAGYHSIILRSHNGTNNKYLAYLFLTNDWRRQIREKVDGVKVFSISRRILDDTTVIIPPRSEQDAIVAYLDVQCAKVDAMIDKVQSKIGLLEEYRVRLISDVVTGKVRV